MTQASLTEAELEVLNHRGRVVPVVTELALRNYLYMVRIPATVVPVIVMPLFFTLAFSGAFGAITEIPGFPTDSNGDPLNVLNWMAPFAILQGAAFAGLGASFAIGRDLETGFYDRLLVAPVSRVGLFLSPIYYASLRSLVPVVVVIPVAMLGGARIQGGLLGLLTLVLAAVGVGVTSSLWGMGVAYRTGDQRSGMFTQVGIFVVLFLSIGQVPLAAITGWLHGVARVNPLTNVLRLARQGFLGPVTWDQTWPGLLALVVAALFLGLFAARGFRRLVP